MATITGTTGNDRLVGTDDDDLIRGLAGNDVLIGKDGDDRLVGGSGADIFVFEGDDFGFDRILDFNRAQGDKIKLIDVEREIGDDDEDIESFRDLDTNRDGRLDGLDKGVKVINGNLRITFNNDRDDDDDDDVAIIWVKNTEYLLRSDFIIVSDDDDKSDRSSSVTTTNKIIGTKGNDRLVGTDGDDFIRGLAGNDVLFGKDGNDRLLGDSGADYFVFKGDDFGFDRILDFNRAQGDKIVLIDVERDDEDIESFRDLDTNRDGRLDARDKGVSLVNGSLKIVFEDDDDDDDDDVAILWVKNTEFLLRSDFIILDDDDDDDRFLLSVEPLPTGADADLALIG